MFVTNPIIASYDGIKIKPELMKNEKLYHCVVQDKILLVYKDYQDILNCYEIEEKELVDKVKKIHDTDSVEKIFEEYITRGNLKH